MDIEYVTHASLKLSLPGRTLLLDPFYFFDATTAAWMCHYPPRDIVPEQLGRIDHVFSSHVHPDHSHPRTLAALKDQIGQVLLPAERPSLLARYQGLGFDDIQLLQNGQTLRLADDLAVTCFWSGPVDSVLVVEAGGSVVVHQNDCELGPAEMRQIGERFRIDYAFMCYTRAQDLYPLLLQRPVADLDALAREREEAGLLYNLRCIDAWRPRAVVPYSMTMTYFHPEQLHLNGHGRLVPGELCERLRAARPWLRAFVMHPGDVVEAGSGELRSQERRWRWGDSLAEYLANVAEYVRSEDASLPPFEPGDPERAGRALAAFVEARLREKPIPDFLAGKVIAIHVTGGAGRHRMFVDIDAHAALASPGRAPFLQITMPAAIADVIVAQEYDPFSVLFSYRVTFRLPPGVTLPPRDEVQLYILLFVALFAPEALGDA